MENIMSLQLAIKILESVPVQRGKQRLCSVITDRKGNVLSIGQNSYVKTHPLQARAAKRLGKEESCYLHSEIDAVRRLGRDAYKARNIYVARLDKQGNTAIAKPCEICQSVIDMMNLNVEYTT
jgi:tRNA(Arg) A34 adenosine deaminase TadA